MFSALGCTNALLEVFLVMALCLCMLLLFKLQVFVLGLLPQELREGCFCQLY